MYSLIYQKIKQITLFNLLLIFSFVLNGQEVKLGMPIGHLESINSSVFSPNGRLVATSSQDNSAKIWDVATGRQIHSLEGHKSVVHGAVFSPNGHNIATWSKDRLIKIWDVKSGQELRSLDGHKRSICNVEFSPDGNLILSASFDSTAKLWSTESGQLIQTFNGHSSKVFQATFSPNGESVATVSQDKSTKIWDIITGKIIWSLEGTGVEFSPNGNTLITLASKDQIILWDSKSGQKLRTLKGHTAQINSASFSHDGQLIISASEDSTVKLWSTTSSKPIHTLVGHKDAVSMVAFNHNNSQIVSCSKDKTIKIWDITSGLLDHSILSNSSPFYSASFSPDGHKLLCHNESIAYIWDISSEKVIHRLKGSVNGVINACLSSDMESLLTVTKDGIINTWNTKSGKLRFSINSNGKKVKSAIFSPDGQQILTLFWNESSVKLWDVSTGKLLHKFEGHTDAIQFVSFSPNGKRVVTSSNDKTARVYDVNTGTQILVIRGHTSAIYFSSFKPDGRHIVTASADNSAKIWNAQTGALIHSLDRHSSFVYRAHYSLNGKVIVTFSHDRTVKVWDASTGNLISSYWNYNEVFQSAIPSNNSARILTTSSGPFNSNASKLWDQDFNEIISPLKHLDWITSAKFSPDEKSILTSSLDHFANLWDATSGNLVHSFKCSGGVNYADFIHDGYRIITASNDGATTFWDRISGKSLLQHFILDSDPNKWVHLHPSGLFDASPEAMKLMYWTKGLELIEFSQLKDRYWLPGLWEKVMSGESLPDVADMSELKLQLEIELGEIENGKLPIKLTKRDGGYGKVSVFVNGKEVQYDIRGNQFDTTLTHQTIYFSLDDLKNLTATNNIEVKASSADGFVQGRGVGIEYKVEDVSSDVPDFYAILIGVEDYANDAINLNFPAADAKAMEKALQMGANNLFGTDKTFTYNITSNGTNRPDKATIKQTFEEVSRKAKADDILMVYLSGHGITWGRENPDFYFLTADALAANKEAYNDNLIRSRNTISTSEMVQWINAIAANKQVMVIDACGSGQAVENLIVARDVDATQIKAIDRMKDRTGMFVLSGCAADAVSYEASQYGQGLLTYSLLQAMKGAALKENKYVDVQTLLSHARETVPKLAGEVGGIQVPQFLYPKSGSFDIGLLNEKDKVAIPLNAPRKVFIRSVLVDKNKYRDVAGLSKLLNTKLDEYSSENNANLVYFDSEEYGGACQITGGYTTSAEGILADITVICGESQKEYHIEAESKDLLIEKISMLID